MWDNYPGPQKIWVRGSQRAESQFASAEGITIRGPRTTNLIISRKKEPAMISCFYTCSWNLGTPNVQIVSKNNVETLHMRMLRKLHMPKRWNGDETRNSLGILVISAVQRQFFSTTARRPQRSWPPTHWETITWATKTTATAYENGCGTGMCQMWMP